MTYRICFASKRNYFLFTIKDFIKLGANRLRLSRRNLRQDLTCPPTRRRTRDNNADHNGFCFGQFDFSFCIQSTAGLFHIHTCRDIRSRRPRHTHTHTHTHFLLELGEENVQSTCQRVNSGYRTLKKTNY